MYRLRFLLQGPFAAFVVVWAFVLAGVHMAPGGAWSPVGPVIGEVPGNDLRTPAVLLVQPLIAEVPGLGANPEVPAAPTHGDQGGPGALAARNGGHAAPPPPATRTPRWGPYGFAPSVDRCQWLCTYRL